MNTQMLSISAFDEICALAILLGEDAHADSERHIRGGCLSPILYSNDSTSLLQLSECTRIRHSHPFSNTHQVSSAETTIPK